jgi:hypothetical protein
MALNDKNILITPNAGSGTDSPKIQLTGASTTTSATIVLSVYSETSGTVSVAGDQGQLFNIANAYSGTFFSVGDVSGIPSLEVLDSGQIKLAQYYGYVSVLSTSASVSTSTGALVVTGGVGIGQNLYIGGNATVAGTLFAAISGSVTTATNIQSGGVGQIPVQAATGVTGFFGPGVSGQILVSAGTTSTGPVFTNTSTIFVGYANTANNVSSLATGTANQLLYQVTTGTTGFIVAPTINSTYLFWNGTSFSWTNNLPGTTSTFVINNATQSIATNSGALQIVNGGAGIGGNLNVGGSAQIGGIFTVTSTASSISTTTGALQVAGGAGIGGNLNVGGDAKVSGNTTFVGNVTFNGTATYVYSTNTYYTDNLIELHLPQGGVNSLWNADDGKDIGLRFHYYQNSTDTNAALVLANDTKYLEWYNIGVESAGTSTFIGSQYGTAKWGGQYLVNPSQSFSTQSGALQVTGGVGIGRALWVGETIYSSGSVVVTVATLGSYGVSTISAGTDTAVSSSTGNVVVWNTSTLQSITNRGSTTPYSITLTSSTNATSTQSGALATLGGIGIGKDAWIGGSVYIASSATVLNRIYGNLTGIATTATNLDSGSLGQIPYQTSAGLTGFFGPGSSGQILVSQGTAAPAYTNTSTIMVGFAQQATNLQSGVQGSLPYQSSTGTTTFLGIGTNGTILTSNGTGPTWASLSGLSAGQATTATNIANGGVGQLIYQVSTGSTGFVGTGTSGQLLISNGTSGPSFVNTNTIYVKASVSAENANTINGGTSGQLVYQSAAGSTSFAGPGTIGQILTSNGTGAPTYVNTNTVYVGAALGANSIFAGNTGTILYQSAPGVTAFLTPGSTGTLLLSPGPGQVPQYTNTSSIYVNSSVLTENLRGGANGSLPYQTGAGATTFLAIGTNGYVLTSNGSTPAWSSFSGISAGSATTATNIANGTAGQLVYQVTTGSTSFAGPGTSGQFLKSNGTSAPSYVDTSTMYVANSLVANGVLGGTAGQLLVQTAASATSFITGGAAGQILVQSNAGTAPVFTNTSTFRIGYADASNNIIGGTSGQLHYQSGVSTTAFAGPGTAGQLIASNGTSGPQYLTTGNVYVGYAQQSANLLFGAPGAMPYQSATGTTAMLSIGNNGFVLTSTGSLPQWQALSGLSSGNATTATNIAGGTAGQVPYQTGVGSTAFYGPGTAGQLLISQGATAPIYTNTNTFIVGFAVSATNVIGGLPNQLVYQSSTGTTGFVGPGSQGQLLVSQGTSSAPAYTNTSSIMVRNAELATNILGGAGGSILYQSAANATTSLAIGSAGQLLVVNSGGTAPVWTSISGLSAGSATTATNLAAGTAFQIPYQTAPGITSFINSGTTGQLFYSNGAGYSWVGPGNSGQLLVSAGTAAPTYTNTSSIHVSAAQFAQTATNVAGGAQGSVLYQSGAGATTSLAIGAAGQVLTVGAGATAPTWSNLSGLSSGFATTATNIAGGAPGWIHYQTNTGTTGFIVTGTIGQILVGNGSNSYTWAGAGSAGNILVSQGAAVPQYQNTLTISGSVAAQSVTLGTLAVPNGGIALGGDLWMGGILKFNSSGQINTNGSGAIYLDTGQQVGIGTGATIKTRFQVGARVTDDNGFAFDSNTTYLVHQTPTATAVLNDPKQVLILGRQGTSAQAFGAAAAFNLARWENNSVNSRTRLDLQLAHDSFFSTVVTATTWLSNGNVGFGGQSNPQYTIDVTGSARITGNLTVGGTINASITGQSSTATSLAGGTQGQLVYQSAPGVTAFHGPGTAGQILLSNGTSGPSYTNTSSIYVNSAKNAETIIGGSALQLVYQVSAGSSGFVTAPTVASTYLQYNGTGFVWSAVASGGSAVATTATNLAGGTVGQIPFQTAPGLTSFFSAGTAGQILVSAGAVIGGHTFTNTSTFRVGFADYANNVVGGAIGNLVYQSGANTTNFVATGASGTLLAGNTGAAPSFISTTSVYVGAAVNANNLFAGTTGQVPYQSAAGTTGFFGPGTSGQLLMSQGATAPAYTNTSTIYVNSSVYTENLRFGATNQIPYQSNANVTTFMTAPTDSTYLTYFTSGGFQWKSIGDALHGLYIDTDGNLQYDIYNVASGAVSININTYALNWFAPNITMVGSITSAGQLPIVVAY